MRYIVHDALGKILRHGTCPDADFIHQASNPGETVIEGVVNDATQYILAGVLTDKAPMPVTVNKTVVNENEAVILSNVPVGTLASVDGDKTIVNDGTLEVIFDTSGEYKIRLSLFPYLDYEVTIKCN